MSFEFALNTLLARNSPSDENDVLAVKGLLNRVGYYDEPDYGITPYPDGRLFQSIAGAPSRLDRPLNSAILAGLVDSRQKGAACPSSAIWPKSPSTLRISACRARRSNRRSF